MNFFKGKSAVNKAFPYYCGALKTKPVLKIKFNLIEPDVTQTVYNLMQL
jgi:hypothetical protein